MSAPRTQALSEGTLGIALLHIERGDLAAAQLLLAEAVSGGVSTGANASLFHGAPALEFVLGRASRTDRGVQDAADRVVAARLAAAGQRRGSGHLPSLEEFDLIRGLTGLAALLLTRPDPPPLTAEVLTYLVSLARPAGTGDRSLPGWWTADSPAHEEVAGGHGNNGMAHGVAGPLALLSIAARRGIWVKGQASAIDMFACWLEKFGGTYWTTREQLSVPGPPQAPPLRPFWCYGALGIARALQLAAIATGNANRRQSAEDTAMAALADPARLTRVTDASLCHGWAGILTVTRAIAAESPDPDRFSVPLRLARRHLAAGIGALPKPGVLEGRAGAQLALDGTNTTGWTRALLID